jgi:hypothetical protein
MTEQQLIVLISIQSWSVSSWIIYSIKFSLWLILQTIVRPLNGNVLLLLICELMTVQMLMPCLQFIRVIIEVIGNCDLLSHWFLILVCMSLLVTIIVRFLLNRFMLFHRVYLIRHLLNKVASLELIMDVATIDIRVFKVQSLQRWSHLSDCFSLPSFPNFLLILHCILFYLCFWLSLFIMLALLIQCVILRRGHRWRFLVMS